MRYLDIPAKVLSCSVVSATGLEKWPYDDGMGDPFWMGGPNPADYRWELTLAVDPQSHSSHKTRKPFGFNGMDVKTGDWIAHQSVGSAVRVVSVTSKTEDEVVCIVEDVLRYNTFRSPGGEGSGIFTVPSVALIFELNEDGIPVVDPIPAVGVGPDFFANLTSRFQNQEKNAHFILEKENHGFAVDQLIAIDTLNNTFVLADADHPFVIGSVSYVDIGPNFFAINPIQKIVDNLNSLPGDVADILYSDPQTPGALTSVSGSVPVYVKLRGHTQSQITGRIANPTTDPNNVFVLNKAEIMVGGDGDLSAMISAINSMIWSHGVIASSMTAPTDARTDIAELALGEPAMRSPVGDERPTATINGVEVTFQTNAPGEDYILEEGMAEDINNAGIPDVVALFESNILIVRNMSGGPVTIVNGQPDSDGVFFAGPMSGSGVPLSTDGSGAASLKLLAIDARAIDLLDVVGEPTKDFGIFSVENGQKAAALYVEHGIRQGSLTVVADNAARAALSPMIGDQAYVLDKGDEEWGLYLYDGSNWSLVATEESAKTDADTYMVEITHESDLDGIIGEMNDNSRVNTVAVRVIEPFSGGATISVGTDTDHDLLMTIDQNDLLNEGEYATTPTYVFDVGSDTTVHYYLTLNGATSGRAQVSISYS